MVTNASKREKQPFSFTKKDFQKSIKSESVSKCSRHTFIFPFYKLFISLILTKFRILIQLYFC